MCMLRLHFIACASCFRERISSMAIGIVTEETEEIVFIMASGDRSVWVTHAAVSVSGLGMSWKNWVLRASLGTVIDSATHSLLARAGLVRSVSHIATRLRSCVCVVGLFVGGCFFFLCCAESATPRRARRYSKQRLRGTAETVLYQYSEPDPPKGRNASPCGMSESRRSNSNLTTA